jgi:hypothetical protein
MPRLLTFPTGVELGQNTERAYLVTAVLARLLEQRGHNHSGINE